MFANNAQRTVKSARTMPNVLNAPTVSILILTLLVNLVYLDAPNALNKHHVPSVQMATILTVFKPNAIHAAKDAFLADPQQSV